MSALPKKSYTALLKEDPYRTEGIGALKNKLGIKMSRDLAEAELVLSSYRRAQGLPQGSWDWDHLKSIHHHLFKDVYEWAGETRECNLYSDSRRRYVVPENIDRAARAVFSEMKADNSLMGLSEKEFAGKASYYYSRLNAIHPFRSGNGRAIRLFLGELAKQNGYRLDWSKTDAVSWQKACIAAEVDNGRMPLTNIFSDIVVDVGFSANLGQKAGGQSQAEWKAGGDTVIKSIVKTLKENPEAIQGMAPAEDDDDINLGPSPGMG